MSISSKTASSILKEVHLPDGDNSKSYRLAAGLKSTRQNLIKSDPGSEDAKISAAIEIQRAYRGYCTRCRLHSKLHADVSKTAVYSESKPALERLEDVPSPVPSPQKGEEAEKTISESPKPKSSSPVVQTGKSTEKTSSPTVSKPQTSRPSSKTIVSRSPQASPKPASKPKPASAEKKKREPVNLDTQTAATIIQKAWRKHIDVQVYHYYRDLINFKNRGDPAMMLRCINPNEAKMMDAAMGIHIKFRLAGERFPPNIYYKVFTHRPIQDLCANSPKDYTHANTKRQMARDIHNKGGMGKIGEPEATEDETFQTDITGDREGWYQREENNGWRLVSDRMIQHILNDPVTWETSKKKIQFHHNKYQRKVDIERRKKKKKIDWMKKMYREGMVKAKVEDPETVKLIEGAAAGMVAAIERHGDNAVQDWEVDELLEWTTSLNFEDYWSGWKEIATSANSEKPVEERLNLTAAENDPFEMTLRPFQRDGSTRQSHNTPVSCQSAASNR